jgi:hypothetical protein
VPLTPSPVPLLEIGARTATGYSSGAYRCLGADDRYYFVKSPRLAGARAVISEWLAAGLAEAMGLPAREAVIVDIPFALVTPEIRELGHGLAFGSLELAHADDLSFSSAAKLPTTLRAELFLFDYWIQNADRILGPAGGNPNLLVATGHPLAVIDHGNAFDAHFNSNDFCDHHAFADRRVEWLDANRRQTWEAKASAALERVPDLWDGIPLEWHENAHGEIQHEMTLENVLHLLNRFTRDPASFWSPLRSS